MEPNFLNGTVELMLLSVIDEGPSYGYEITQSVLNRSGGRFDVKEGSLYPALHRLERAKLLQSYWTEHEGRRRKYYRLTPSGRKALAARRTEWQSFSEGLRGVLGLEQQSLGDPDILGGTDKLPQLVSGLIAAGSH